MICTQVHWFNGNMLLMVTDHLYYKGYKSKHFVVHAQICLAIAKNQIWLLRLSQITINISL